MKWLALIGREAEPKNRPGVSAAAARERRSLSCPSDLWAVINFMRSLASRTWRRKDVLVCSISLELYF